MTPAELEDETWSLDRFLQWRYKNRERSVVDHLLNLSNYIRHRRYMQTYYEYKQTTYNATYSTKT